MGGRTIDLEANEILNSVHSESPQRGYVVSEEQILKFDRTYDDGNITSGRMRKLSGDRY